MKEGPGDGDVVVCRERDESDGATMVSIREVMR